MAPVQKMYSAIENEMCCFVILCDEADNAIFSDLMGRFLIELYTGIDYICVCYVYKLNIVLLLIMKNSEDKEMIIVFKSCYEELKIKGHHHTLHVLDNVYSHAVKEYITSERTDM